MLREITRASGADTHLSLARAVLVTACLMLVSGAARAQVPQPIGPREEPPGWQVSMTPYFWGVALDGDIEAGNTKADLDSSFSDIFDALNFAAMGVVEARRDRFFTRIDALYGDLEDEGSSRALRVEGRSRQLILDSKLGYRIWENPQFRDRRDEPHEPGGWAVDLVGGLRYSRIRNEVDLRIGPTAVDSDDIVDWLDPVLGLRLRGDLTQRVALVVIADGGGFGIGSASDFTWSSTAALALRVGERWAISAGYKVLDIDRSKVDVRQHGPLLGVTYAF